MIRPTQYIVEEKLMVNAVKFGLEQSIKDKAIIDQLMRPIIEELEIVLEDDCEEMTEEMWSAMMV